MLARGIPSELSAAMAMEDAIDLGWSRNFPRMAIWDGSGKSEGFYPGLALLREHVALNEVIRVLNNYNKREHNTLPKEVSTRHPVLKAQSWDEFNELVHDQRYPILTELMFLLAKATGKTIYVTKVEFSDGAGIYEGIDVCCYRVTATRPEVTPV